MKHRSRILSYHSLLPLLSLAVSLFVLFLSPLRGSTQWRVISNAPFRVTEVYANDGAVWVGNLDGFHESLDSGRTWQNIIKSPTISFVDFFDKNIVVYFDNSDRRLHLSVNRGVVWNLISLPVDKLNGIVRFGRTPNDIYVSFAHDLYVSHDRGITWFLRNISDVSTRRNDYRLGGLFYVTRTGKIYLQSSYTFLISLDDGAHWSTSFIAQKTNTAVYNEIHRLAIDSCDDNIAYAEFDDGSTLNGEGVGVLGTFDRGWSWKALYQASGGGSSSDHLCTFKEGVARSLATGMIRSTNYGISWDNIGGPDAPDDNAPSIAALSKDIFFVIDRGSNLWCTINGGGITPNPPVPAIIQDTILLTSCDSIFRLEIPHWCCPGDSGIHWDTVHFSGTDTSFFTIVSKGKDSQKNIDTAIIAAVSIDSLKKEAILAFRDGCIERIYHFFSAKQYFDSSQFDNYIVFPEFLDFEIDTICDISDWVKKGVIYNRSCFPVDIDLLYFSGSDFEFLEPKFPMRLLDTTTYVIRYRPGGSSRSSGKMVFKVTFSNEIERTLTVTLRGSLSIPPSPLLVPAKVDFGIVSLCQSSMRALIINNPYCDSIRIVDVSSPSDTVFKVLSSGVNMWVGSGGSISFPVYFSPTKLGGIDIPCTVHCMTTWGGEYWYRIDLLGFGRENTQLASIDNTLKFDTVNVCTSRQRSTWIRNISCDTMTVLFVSAPLNPVFVMNAPVFPIKVPPRDSLEIPFVFSPKKLGISQDNVKIEIKPYYGTTQGFRLDLRGYGRVPVQVASLGNTMNFDTVSTCETKEKTILLYSICCDSFQIEELLPPRNKDFTVVRPSALSWVRSGDSTAVTVRYHTSSNGADKDSIEFRLRSAGGLGQILYLRVSGFGQAEPPNYISSSSMLSFDTLTLCQSGKRSWYLVNATVCTDMRIDSLWLTGAGEYSFTSPASYPLILHPHDTLWTEIDLDPTSVGAKNAVLWGSISTEASKKIIEAPISGFIIHGGRTLATLPSTADFGMLDICQLRDTLVTIRNSGCEALHIDSLMLSGNGFFIVAGPSLPATLLPNDSISLRISLLPDTTGGKQSNNAVLNILSDSDPSLAGIPLNARYRIPMHYDLSLVDRTPELHEPGDVAHLALHSAGDLSVLKHFDCELSVNSDLLEYAGYEGSNIVVLNGARLSLDGTPYIQADNNGDVGVLKFREYFTKDTETTLALSDAHFTDNGPSNPNCPSTMDVKGILFEAKNICGGDLLRQFLYSDPFELITIRPNPAAGNITLTVRSRIEEEGEAAVYSILGERIFSVPVQLLVGTNQFLLGTSGLAEGNYVIRLHTSSATTSKSLLIVR